MRIAIPILVLAISFVGCDHSSPTAPNQAVAPTPQILSLGHWASEGSACMTVEPAQVTLSSGCWRGRFPTPVVSESGTFSVDGTFRFEAGPSTDTPAPPARFTGTIRESTLSLTVQQADSSQPPVTYSFTFRAEGQCAAMCV